MGKHYPFHSGQLKGGDLLCYIGFGLCANDITAQINDSLISNVSRMIDGKLLDGSSTRLIDNSTLLLDQLISRLTLKYYCKKVISATAAPSVILIPKDIIYNSKILEYFERSDSLTKSYSSSKVVEFSTLSLLNPARRRMFDFNNCEDPSLFGEDYIITIFLDQLFKDSGSSGSSGPSGSFAPSGSSVSPTLPPPAPPQSPAPAPLGQRHFPLDFSPGTIILSARNKWTKNKISAKMVKDHPLIIKDAFLSPDQAWNNQELEARLSFAHNCLIQLWVIKMLQRENVLKLRPKFTCRLCNFLATITLDMLTSDAPIPMPNERILWRAFSIIIDVWINLVMDFYEQGKITGLTLKIQPVLNFVSRLLIDCPYEEEGCCFQVCAIKRTIKRAKGLLLSLWEKVESTTPSSNTVDLKFALLTLESCQASLSKKANPEVFDAFPKEGVLVGGPIGFGNSAVYKVFDFELKNVVAIKEVKNLKLANDNLAQELNYLQYLKHPHIVKFYRATPSAFGLYLIMEYCSGGMMQDYIRNSKSPINDSVFRRFTMQVLQGLSYLHRNGVVHGDIKPANILVSVYENVKLADFGATRLLADTVVKERGGGNLYQYSLGTATYMAPETLLQLETSITTQSDMWSLGCTLFQLATGIPPWVECENLWKIIQSFNEKRIFPISELYNSKLDQRAIQIILSCLQLDPSLRPSSTELLLDPYFYEGKIGDDDLVFLNDQW